MQKDSIIKIIRAGDNKHLGKGSVRLMHNGAKYTSKAMELVIKGLQDTHS